MPAPTLYQLLDVSATASADDLRQAFRLLSKRYHPDTTSMPPPQAAAAFQRLQQAYGVLSDPEARRRYDSQLQLELAPPPALVVQRPLPVRRALSGGEWLALLLLGLAVLFSLVLGVGMAWMRGVELVQWPSWWVEMS
jgi:curved DNA-binding protein CbpA